MSRLAAPLGFRKPAEQMPRVERRWHHGIVTTLRAILSKPAASDAAMDDAVSRLKQLD